MLVHTFTVLGTRGLFRGRQGLLEVQGIAARIADEHCREFVGRLDRDFDRARSPAVPLRGERLQVVHLERHRARGGLVVLVEHERRLVPRDGHNDRLTLGFPPLPVDGEAEPVHVMSLGVRIGRDPEHRHHRLDLTGHAAPWRLSVGAS